MAGAAGKSSKPVGFVRMFSMIARTEGLPALQKGLVSIGCTPLHMPLPHETTVSWDFPGTDTPYDTNDLVPKRIFGRGKEGKGDDK